MVLDVIARRSNYSCYSRYTIKSRQNEYCKKPTTPSFTQEHIVWNHAICRTNVRMANATMFPPQANTGKRHGQCPPYDLNKQDSRATQKGSFYKDFYEQGGYYYTTSKEKSLLLQRYTVPIVQSRNVSELIQKNNPHCQDQSQTEEQVYRSSTQ